MPFSSAVDINPKRPVKRGAKAPFVEMAAVSTSNRFIRYLSDKPIESGGSRFQNGDTLFARITPCAENGKIALVNLLPDQVVGAGSTEFIVFGPRDDLTDPEFVYHLARSDFVRGPALAQMIGTTGRRRVPNAVFDEIVVAIPPLPEQRRIAEILSSVDDAIQSTQAVIDQTRRVKQGVLERLLTKGIGHTRFKQTEIGEIPETWSLRPLADVCLSVTVGIASSATHAYCDNGIPLIRNQNIKPGYIDREEMLFVSQSYDQSYKNKRVRAGDVITMRTGYPGRSAVVPRDLDGCQTFTTLISRPDRELLIPEFLCLWINSHRGTVEVRKRQAGGAQQNLNAGVMKQIPVPLPPLSEQEEIVAKLNGIPIGDGLSREVNTLRNIKRALMAELLTGRLRVPADLPMAAE